MTLGQYSEHHSPCKTVTQQHASDFEIILSAFSEWLSTEFTVPAFSHQEAQLSYRTSLVAQTIKNLPAMQETWVRSLSRSPGEGNGSPLQYSCLENSMDRGAWWATAHVVAKSWT